MIELLLIFWIIVLLFDMKLLTFFFAISKKIEFTISILIEIWLFFKIFIELILATKNWAKTLIPLFLISNLLSSLIIINLLKIFFHSLLKKSSCLCLSGKNFSKISVWFWVKFIFPFWKFSVISAHCQNKAIAE